MYTTDGRYFNTHREAVAAGPKPPENATEWSIICEKEGDKWTKTYTWFWEYYIPLTDPEALPF